MDDRDGAQQSGLVTLGDGERLDDARELTELGGDAVTLDLELGDLGARPLERPSGTLAELVGLGTALAHERQ